MKGPKELRGCIKGEDPKTFSSCSTCFLAIDSVKCRSHLASAGRRLAIIKIYGE